MEVNIYDLSVAIYSWLQQGISGINKCLGWFIQNICSQIDNREIASLILLAAFVVFAAIKGGRDVARSAWDVVLCILKPQILIPAMLLVAYSVLLVNLAVFLDLWSSELLLDTVLEILFVGFPSLAIAVNARTITSTFKQLVVPEVCLGAFVAFYIGMESFSLLVELFLQIVICFFGCGKLVWGRNPDGKAAARLSNAILAIVGIAVFIAMTCRLAGGWDSFDWMVEAKTLLMMIWYPMLLMPYVILLGYYAAFEKMLLRAKTSTKRIGAVALSLLFLHMLPSLRNMTHFGGYEMRQYADCASWRERRQYCKSYKDKIKVKAEEENSKLERMESGKGKRGFDGDGLWLDWDNLEKIKTALWTVASVQNRNWVERGAYTSDMQVGLVDIFTPRGCTGGSYVSDDCRSFACWMSNGTGFTFGMAASDGMFPPLRYEGKDVPSIVAGDLLTEFVSEREADRLPNWFACFHVDGSYR